MVAVRLSDAEMAQLERHRASLDRGAFLRFLLLRWVREKAPLPDAREHIEAIRAQRKL